MTRPVTVTDRTGLSQALRQLKLSGMQATLDARLAQAAAGDFGHLDFLQVLCEDEITRRATVSLAKRLPRARFEGKPPCIPAKITHRQPSQNSRQNRIT